LLGIHVGLLVVSEFEILPIPVLDRYADFPLVMGLLPIVASHRGRLAAWLVALPITLLPIAGKTLRQLVYEQPTLSPTPGWLLYGIGPVAVALVLALRLARAPDAADARGRTFRVGLGFATLVYFALNYAFFRFPWPWATWTARTPNAIVFAFCAAALLTLACRGTRLRPRPHEETPRSLGTGA
ncbi:MAG: hypothetical protein JNL97_17370, partial [Verrucomicrobiales bacterium]|nr:hypothetical protein [Verrucomicrobiales bacterium]